MDIKHTPDHIVWCTSIIKSLLKRGAYLLGSAALDRRLCLLARAADDMEVRQLDPAMFSC